MINYGKSHLVEEPKEYGKVVYIIGESKTGPLGEPVYIETVDQAIEIFGEGYLSSLTRSYIQFNQSGGEGAYLVKLNGSYSSVTLKGYTDEVVDVLDLEFDTCGELGNETRVLINQGFLVIKYKINNIQKIKRFSLTENETIYELANDINKSMKGIINAFSLEDKCSTISLMENNDTINEFTGGENNTNLTKNELYYKLENILEVLLGKNIDILCLSEMYFDDIVPDHYNNLLTYSDSYYTDDRDYLDIDLDNGEKAGFHKLLIDFCISQAQIGIITHSIMGVNPLPNDLDDDISIASVLKSSTALKNYDGIRILDGSIQNDHGQYITLCCGDISYQLNPSFTFKDNFYLSYAAIWVNSITSNSLTGETIIIDNGEFITEFDNSTNRSLSNMGIVTYKYSPLRNWCTTSGITLANKNNPMLYSVNIKIVQKVLKELDNDLNTYVETSNAPIITGDYLSKVVENSLSKRRDEEKIINSYNYIISYINETNTLEIQLELETIYTIEKIKAQANVQITKDV
jgi:hypothetical protein